MAAMTEQTRSPVLPPPAGRAGLGGTLRSEFTKIRSVRSTYWTLLVLLVVSVGIGAAISAGTAANWSHTSPSDRATFDATQASIAGLFYLGQLVIVVLGALVCTSEYSTGMIRTSLTAMPRRVTVYAAKAVVVRGDRPGGHAGGRVRGVRPGAGAAGQHARQRDPVRAERAARRDRQRPVRHAVRAVRLRGRVDHAAHRRHHQLDHRAAVRDPDPDPPAAVELATTSTGGCRTPRAGPSRPPSAARTRTCSRPGPSSRCSPSTRRS